MTPKVAYFSAEYALGDGIAIYAGGLGILAGDYIREAGDQALPLVAIGMHYSEGFTHTELSPEGAVVDLHEGKTPEEVGLKLVLGSEGKALIVYVPIGESKVGIKAWEYVYKTVKVYLLDTKVEGNSEQDKHITDTLYTTDKETRFKQEMVLGVGGFKMLLALGLLRDFYHLNEGHCAFLVYELIHHEMEKSGLSFEEAKRKAKERILFTNHTLVAAGNDVYSNDLAALLLSRYGEEIGVPVKQLVDLGIVQQSSTFSMTMLALRTAGKVNAVSRLHAKKAREIWSDHPMVAITNGIHLPTWDRIGEAEIWSKHRENKRALLSHIAQTTGVVWEENVILLGWGRRIVRYKRPLALVERLKQFGEMARDPERGVHVVYSGIAHPSDEDGHRLLEELQYRLNSDLKGVAVYLPHYNMELSSLMTAGCDAWINTPVVGFEACGTSGMKAALNGVLPLSTRDGWVDEVELLGIGWGLSDSDLTEDMLLTLRNRVLPLYYSRDEAGVPQDWVVMMQNARRLILNEFGMGRAMRQYLDLLSQLPTK